MRTFEEIREMLADVERQSVQLQDDRLRRNQDKAAAEVAVQTASTSEAAVVESRAQLVRLVAAVNDALGEIVTDDSDPLLTQKAVPKVAGMTGRTATAGVAGRR